MSPGLEVSVVRLDMVADCGGEATPRFQPYSKTRVHFHDEGNLEPSLENQAHRDIHLRSLFVIYWLLARHDQSPE